LLRILFPARRAGPRQPFLFASHRGRVPPARILFPGARPRTPPEILFGPAVKGERSIRVSFPSSCLDLMINVLPYCIGELHKKSLYVLSPLFLFGGPIAPFYPSSFFLVVFFSSAKPRLLTLGTRTPGRRKNPPFFRHSSRAGISLLFLFFGRGSLFFPTLPPLFVRVGDLFSPPHRQVSLFFFFGGGSQGFFFFVLFGPLFLQTKTFRYFVLKVPFHWSSFLSSLPFRGSGFHLPMSLLGEAGSHRAVLPLFFWTGFMRLCVSQLEARTFFFPVPFSLDGVSFFFELFCAGAGPDFLSLGARASFCLLFFYRLS